jgi:CubicO group peptidase (beta-lactamase class C family)
MSFLHELLEKSVEESATPGFALVECDESQKHFEYFGKLRPDGEEVNNETFYDLASLTKVVGTTTRLLQFIDSGRISFETKVCEIFPKYSNLEMTIGQVMLHQAGFIADFEDKKKFSEKMLWDYLKDFQYRSHQEMKYSDLDYLLLGEIIEKVDGCDLEESFTKHIFNPIKMSKTTFYPHPRALCAYTEKTNDRGFIQGVVHDSKAYHFGRPAGHAGLFSTAEDIGIFLQAFLNGQLFSEKCYDELLRTEENGRTYGWAVFEKAGQIYHTGFTGGLICLDLHRKKGLGLLSNSICPSREDKRFIEIRREVCQLFFEGLT